MGEYNDDVARLFSEVWVGNTRGNGHKMQTENSD